MSGETVGGTGSYGIRRHDNYYFGKDYTGDTAFRESAVILCSNKFQIVSVLQSALPVYSLVLKHCVYC